MKFKDRNKLIALLATLLCCVAIVLMLVFSYLDYEGTPKDRPLPPESEIIFGGEYVMLGNVPRPAKNKMDNAQPATQKEESQPDAQDMSNEGTAGDVPDLVSSDAESEMKVKKKEKPEKTGQIGRAHV